MRGSTKHIVIVLAAIVAAGYMAAAAHAGYIYLPAAWHVPGDVGNSTFSTSWYDTTNYSPNCCIDKQAVFIDNVTYSWHGQTRNTNNATTAHWYAPSIGKKGNCTFFSGGNTACSVFP
jgi:hypothetical protein